MNQARRKLRRGEWAVADPGTDDGQREQRLRSRRHDPDRTGQPDMDRHQRRGQQQKGDRDGGKERDPHRMVPFRDHRRGVAPGLQQVKDADRQQQRHRHQQHAARQHRDQPEAPLCRVQRQHQPEHAHRDGEEADREMRQPVLGRQRGIGPGGGHACASAAALARLGRQISDCRV
jgi:FtsZ-interacting cell division protein ZipA